MDELKVYFETTELAHGREEEGKNQSKFWVSWRTGSGRSIQKVTIKRLI